MTNQNDDDFYINNIFENFGFDFSSKKNNIFLSRVIKEKKDNVQQILEVIKQSENNPKDTRNKYKNDSVKHTYINLNKHFTSKSSNNKVTLPHLNLKKFPDTISMNDINLKKEGRSLIIDKTIFVDKKELSNNKSRNLNSKKKVSCSYDDKPSYSTNLGKNKKIEDGRKILMTIYQNCLKEQQITDDFTEEIKRNNSHKLKKINLNKVSNTDEIGELSKNRQSNIEEIEIAIKFKKRDKIMSISPNLAFRARNFFVENFDVNFEGNEVNFEIDYKKKEKVKETEKLFHNVNNLLDICDKKKNELMNKLSYKYTVNK